MRPLSTSLLLHLTLLLALALASVSCQSAKTAFQFSPTGPQLSVPATSSPASAPAHASVAETETIATIPAVERRTVPRLAARPHFMRRCAASATAAAYQSARPQASLRASLRAQNFARQFQARQPMAPAENGLGTMFLGIFGILALLVGLVGLIFSGGGFFGVLAAGGAIALAISVLVPYFTGG